MSSLKNAMKTQKVHRERHQNEARAHLGPLEKKKDYKIRAKDQEKKKKLLKTLHKKALERNPDEFHFHMLNSRMEDGVHREDAEKKTLSIKDLKEDLTYIKFRRTMEQSKITRLQASLQLLEVSNEGDEPLNSHLLFVDSIEQAKNTDAATLLNTRPELLGHRFNRPTLEQLQQMPDQLQQQMCSVKESTKANEKAYKELCQRTKRDDQLRLLQEKLQVRLDLMVHKEQNKRRVRKLPGPKRIKKGTDKAAPVYKWPAIRKK